MSRQLHFRDLSTGHDHPRRRATLRMASRAVGNVRARFPMCYGPELIAAPFRERLKRVGVEPINVFPGSPWENGYNERFNSTLRREVLNREWFASIQQARSLSTGGCVSTIISARITRSACEHRSRKP
ncbi:MAG: integrase core domain-containing protein [Rhizobiaceae bacterium]|nr:integrase core domain-containing protein [Rhizobiaceae bacterium]